MYRPTSSVRQMVRRFNCINQMFTLVYMNTGAARGPPSYRNRDRCHVLSRKRLDCASMLDYNRPPWLRRLLPTEIHYDSSTKKRSVYTVHEKTITLDNVRFKCQI